MSSVPVIKLALSEAKIIFVLSYNCFGSFPDILIQCNSLIHHLYLQSYSELKQIPKQ